MLDYDRVRSYVLSMGTSPSASRVGRLQRALVGLWLADYERATSRSHVVETESGGYSYLFDVEAQRLLAAWGLTRGANDAPRNASRMRRHPRGGGADYDRGHAIAHSLGGGEDINLVPQRSRVNRGPFQMVESEARQTTGALYFSYWRYGDATVQTPAGLSVPSQTPVAVEQGLLIPGVQARIVEFPN